ncbi:MAG: aspartyl protease family protein [Candidatus Omnitrophica bacterium]|nr:aspartyl protease family protein [Candidatus Omnitrophota bacterium]
MPCCADTIYFHNDERVKGNIVQETQEDVIIDVGGGSITFSKNEIVKIVRSKNNTQKQNVRSVPLQEKARPSLESVYGHFRNLKEKREETITKKRVCKQLYQKIVHHMATNITYNDVLKEMQARADERNISGDVQEYNSIRREMDILQTKKAKLVDEGRKIIENIITQESELFSLLQDLFLLYARFDEEHKRLTEEQVQGEDTYYLKELEEEARGIADDFKRIEIDCFETICGPGVEGVFNGTTQATLSIDTKVPFVILSKELANTLGVHDSLGIGSINLFSFGIEFGDGVPVFLDSIRIEGVTVKNIIAVISDDILYPDVHGILGVPFIRNYAIQIDEEKTTITLHEFKPQ